LELSDAIRNSVSAEDIADLISCGDDDITEMLIEGQC